MVNAESMQMWTDRLKASSARAAEAYPGDRPDRQPVHTVYGGAHLFKAGTPAKLGELALRALDEHAPDARTFADAVGGGPVSTVEQVYERTREKLQSEPVEDYRLDFEDGYGNRSDEEEDSHAVSAAREVAKGMEAGTLPPFIGIRIKPLTAELGGRSLRTLELFLTTLLDVAGGLPDRFVVTLPKIQEPEQIMVLDEALAAMESELDLGRIPIELMVETPQMVINPDGTAGVLRYVVAGENRVRGVHFGVYDYTASMNITAVHQSMTHPVCDFARNAVQVSLAGTGVWLSDGATNSIPVGNTHSVHAAWRRHSADIRHSLRHAYYQGWDVHPAQLPSRYATVFSFFLDGLERAGERLSNFVNRAAQATLAGELFDDAATGRGLLNFFLRAVNAGAISEEEALRRSGLTIEELETGSFLQIVKSRLLSDGKRPNR